MTDEELLEEILPCSLSCPGCGENVYGHLGIRPGDRLVCQNNACGVMYIEVRELVCRVDESNLHVETIWTSPANSTFEWGPKEISDDPRFDPLRDV